MAADGRGQMFADADARPPDPFYDVDVEHGLKHLEHLEPESNLILSRWGRATWRCAIRAARWGAHVPPGTVWCC